jgi:gliding motility-associated-like protein
VNAGNDTVIIRNQPAQLFAQANGTLQWSPSTGLTSTVIPNPITTLSSDQTYYITVNTDDGCSATDTLVVKTFTGPAVYLPNAFTPNNDRLNDVFRPTYVGISNIEGFRVYNRWGQLMFSTTDRHSGWDGRTGGKEQPTGTYVWIATGRNYRNEPFVYRGTVTLIR